MCEISVQGSTHGLDRNRKPKKACRDSSCSYIAAVASAMPFHFWDPAGFACACLPDPVGSPGDAMGSGRDVSGSGRARQVAASRGVAKGGVRFGFSCISKRRLE
jgi:hypothetical protein